MERFYVTYNCDLSLQNELIAHKQPKIGLVTKNLAPLIII